jgi:glycosyltransferase involved in cell wall biosynthesis
MRIAVFNQHVDVGGVEAFLLSLLGQFVRLGHDVDMFLLEPDRDNALLGAMVASGVRVQGIDRLRHGNSSGPFDVALATNPATLFALLRLLHRQRLQADRLVVGVYQTRMFCLDRGPLSLHNRLTRQLFGKLDPRNAIFGNDACRAEHAQAIPAMAAAPVVPLIVDVARFSRRPVRRRDACFRIVSIGRLDHFKTYNLSMPGVIRRLRDAGHPVVWDVYGEGPLRGAMQRCAAELGVREHVRLHGLVDYGAIPEVLAQAFAFVGSGLAMMEAAACGVPAVAAIEYSDQPQTFGFVHQVDGISFFEPGIALPRHDIGEKLLELLDASPDAYESMGDAARAAMMPFSAAVVAPRYLEVMHIASRDHPVLTTSSDAAYRISAWAHRLAGACLRQMGLHRH